MLALLILSCLCNMGSAVPVSAKVAPPLEALPSQRLHPELTEAQTQAPLSPLLEQPQPSSQPLPSPQLLPPLQQYPWTSLGGTPMIYPFQPNIAGSQPPNQPAFPLQPMVFPSFGYMPFFPSPYTNQLFSPYRLPEASLPQTPANQAPHVLPAETTLAAAPGGEVAQTQQQQSPQVVYMVQQPMNPALGGLSSEELQIAAKMSQLGMYMPTVLNNQGTGVVQAGGQAADVGPLAAGVQLKPRTSGGSGGTPCSNNKLQTAARAAAEGAHGVTDTD